MGNVPEIAEHPIELEHVFATFLALLYVPAEMSEFPKVDQTTLMDHSTTHTKLVQHPAKILMSAEMTTEDTTEETSEMETIPTADKIPDSMPIGLLSPFRPNRPIQPSRPNRPFGGYFGSSFGSSGSSFNGPFREGGSGSGQSLDDILNGKSSNDNAITFA